MIKRKKLNRAGPAIAAIACLAVLVTGTPASAATKTLSGEVHCSGMNKVERIWFLGSKSGWHGKDVPKSQRSYEMKYSFKAVQGETIQVWVDCTNAPERYSSFKVGSGSTRHVCDW
ncbi:MAG: hypothetical protein KC561_16635, partial [Myxococcales bacterium]|nr:hypothetical protein [Myxococcales bacterium]